MKLQGIFPPSPLLSITTATLQSQSPAQRREVESHRPRRLRRLRLDRRKRLSHHRREAPDVGDGWPKYAASGQNADRGHRRRERPRNGRRSPTAPPRWATRRRWCARRTTTRTWCNRADAQMLYFRAVADQAKIPMMIYNWPQATGVDISPDAVAQLSRSSQHHRHQGKLREPREGHADDPRGASPVSRY